MFSSVQPGTPGAAARLPKKPGIQKLTPPSSARAAWQHIAMAVATTAAEHRRISGLHPARCAARDSFLAVVACMAEPPLSAPRESRHLESYFRQSRISRHAGLNRIVFYPRKFLSDDRKSKSRGYYKVTRILLDEPARSACLFVAQRNTSWNYWTTAKNEKLAKMLR